MIIIQKVKSNLYLSSIQFYKYLAQALPLSPVSAFVSNTIFIQLKAVLSSKYVNDSYINILLKVSASPRQIIEVFSKSFKRTLQIF